MKKIALLTLTMLAFTANATGAQQPALPAQTHAQAKAQAHAKIQAQAAQAQQVVPAQQTQAPAPTKAQAATHDSTKKTTGPKEEYQNVIGEYKEYLKTVTPSIRDEITVYRKAVANVNKAKKTMYTKLSQEAQAFLKKEREFKRKLPLSHHKFLDNDTAQNKAAAGQ